MLKQPDVTECERAKEILI